MPTYPILQKKYQACETAEILDLPPFYMEDFSVLGFRVSDCSKAEKVLGQEDFVLKRKKKNLWVSIENAAQLQEAVELLEDHDVGCEISDVADGMYQG